MKKARALFKAAFWGFIILFLIFEQREITSAIRQSLKLWSGVLIPSLFPYLVLAQYITASDVMDVFGPVKKIVHRVFNLSESGANVYLCSFVSGYPSGALCAAQLYKDSIIGREEASRLVCFTNNAGPLFVISVVGSDMLRSTGDGLALYVIQSISALVTGICIGKNKEKVTYNTHHLRQKGMSFDRCSQNAINTMLLIGAFMVLTSVVAQISATSFERLTGCDKKIAVYAKAVIYSFLEISNASKILSEFGNGKLNFCFLSAALSWSGLCVLMQIKGVLPDDFSMKKVIWCKLCQSALSFLLAYIYRSLFIIKHFLFPGRMICASLLLSVTGFVFFILKSKNNTRSYAQKK